MTAGTINRLRKLESMGGGPTILGFRWHDDDFVHYQGQQIPLEEWNRLYPDATIIHMTWGDDEPEEE